MIILCSRILRKYSILLLGVALLVFPGLLVFSGPTYARDIDKIVLEDLSAEEVEWDRFRENLIIRVKGSIDKIVIKGYFEKINPKQIEESK